jgi:hypothetical protein
MADTRHIKPATVAVLRVLDRAWPNFVSVPNLIGAAHQSDVRKRISEAIAAGYPIEKERHGRYVNYRWTK